SGANEAAILWDVDRPDGAPLKLPTSEGILMLAMTPDARTVIAGGGGQLRLWRINGSSAEFNVLNQVEETIQEMKVSPDGRWLLTWGPWAYASLTDLKAAHPERVNHILPAEGGPIGKVAFSADGGALATACDYAPDELAAGSNPEKVARLWALQTDDPSSRSLQFSGH